MNNDLFWAAFQDELEKIAIIGGSQGKSSPTVKPLALTKAPPGSAGEVQAGGFPYSKKSPGRRKELSDEVRRLRSLGGPESHRSAREMTALSKSFGPPKSGDPFSTQLARERDREGKMKGSATFSRT